MASTLVVSNFKGDILIYRRYRDDTSRKEVQHFLDTVVAPKKATAPVMSVAGVTFMHAGLNDINIVAASKADVNCMMVLTFIAQFIDVLKAYFEKGEVNEASIRENFSLVYELLDEIVDYGYPQILDPDLLKEYIRTGK
jgi:AP-2 complex subunit mu-1